jgi:anti-sigma B factor antagonist
MTKDTRFEAVECERPGVAVLAASGEIDVATAPELHDRLGKLLQGSPELLVVDLADVSFIDSTGLGVLVGAVRDVRAGGGDLRLVVTQPQIIRLLEITGLDEVFNVRSSTSDAVRS